MRRFLQQLEQALQGEVSAEELQSNLDYYRRYFEQERLRGKSDDEIIGDLGDPRLIARSIIDADRITGKGETNYNAFGAQKSTEQTTSRKTYEKSPRPEEDPNGRRSQQGIGLTSKAGCIIWMVLAIVILISLVVLVTKLMIFLLPAIFIIAAISYLFRGK